MATCYDRYYRRYYTCNSSWYSWGRWVALGVIVGAFILFFFLCSCFTARRRRKAGQRPFYGTGWAVNNKYGQPQQSYQPNYAQQQPAQNTSQGYNQGWNNQQPQQQGGYYGQNQGYYGGQNTEMQAPQNTYRGGENVYSPPAGPPPGK